MSVRKQNEPFEDAATSFIRDRTPVYAPPIASRLRRLIRRELIRGARAGERLSDMTSRVKNILSDQGPFRAIKIARTEVVGAFNAGTLASFSRAGEVIRQKEWLTARDGNVRPTQAGDFDHRSSDGQRRNVADTFEVSGEQLRHPGDPSASPGNIINCRCTMVPVTSRSAAARPPQAGPPETFTPVRTPPPGALLAPKPRRRRPRVRPAAKPRRPTGTTRPRPASPKAITGKAPKVLTEKEVKTEFFGKAQNFLGQPDPSATPLMRTALKDKDFRRWVMVDQVVADINGISVENIGDALGFYSPITNSIELDISLRRLGKKKIAKVMAHEMFHGVGTNRNWFSRKGGSILNLRNPEAARLNKLYRNAVKRTEATLQSQAADAGLSAKTRRESSKWLKTLKKKEKGRAFGKGYDDGVSFFDKMENAGVVDLEKAGLPDAYALHSPHEYSTTSFEAFVFEPETLRRRDPDMFNFFSSFYETGVFKRLTEMLATIARGTGWL